MLRSGRCAAGLAHWDLWELGVLRERASRRPTVGPLEVHQVAENRCELIMCVECGLQP